MKSILVATLALVPIAVAPLLAKDNEPAKRLNEAAAVFSEVMNAPDQGIPQELLENAHCIVIVPGLEDGGFRVWREIWQGISVLPEQERRRMVGARHGSH